MSITLHQDFQKLIDAKLPEIMQYFPTPFFLYTEDGIRQACRKLHQTFHNMPGYRNFYAVKANNNPAILDIVRSEGCGFDCSSTSELKLAMMAGAEEDDMFFSSNNTSEREFSEAFSSGSIFNFDDLSLLDKAPGLANKIACCRYNPGPLARTDGQFVGKPEESKYGLDAFQIMDFFRIMRDKGVKRFMIHTMICSNERDHKNLAMTAKMMLDLASWISRTLGIHIEAINIGGGFGIPYNPATDPVLNMEALSTEITQLFMNYMKKHGNVPKLFTENGRFLTGHSGVLVTKVINTKDIFRSIVGVDAQTFSSVPRPFIYGAYHEITIFGRANAKGEFIYDIAGSLCENADKFATQRLMPKIHLDDILLIHNAGAHCYAMSGNYNGRTRPAEIIIFSDGSFALIRRAQTDEDLFREMIMRDEIKRINNHKP